MNDKRKIVLLALAAVTSCGNPKITNSRTLLAGAPEILKSTDNDITLTQNRLFTTPYVPDSNSALMSAMKSVVQIQITKRRCRNIEEDIYSLKKSRIISDEIKYCTGTVVDYCTGTGIDRKCTLYVLTAAHCLVSSCINNDSTKLSLISGVNDKFVVKPDVKGIKIPSAAVMPVKDVATDASSKFPIMDDFNWEDSTKVLEARDVEFVTGPAPLSPGKSFTATLKGKGNGFPFSLTNGCSSRINIGDGSTTSGTNRYIATTYDVAVIDFGPTLARSYPPVPIPAEPFITNKTFSTEMRGTTSVAKYRFMGVSHSDSTFDNFQHFQKSAHPANADVCAQVQALAGGETRIPGPALGIQLPFADSQDMQDSFTMIMGASGCPGDSGSPMFEEIPVNGGYRYQLAGIQSATYSDPFTVSKASGADRFKHCYFAEGGTYSAIKPADINLALAKIAGRSVAAYPDNMPKTSAGNFVDLWYPIPAGHWIEQMNEDFLVSSIVSNPAVVSNSSTIPWKPLTKSDGVTKILSQNPGQSIVSIATDGLGTRKATWKAGSLAYGYYKVDLQFPKNTSSASCLKVNYETNPIKVKTTKASKVITIMPEGSGTFSLGAYSGNEIAVGDPVKGVGIPLGATVAIAPATRTSSTFTMSVAATATSASTGTPLILISTFRNLHDQKMTGTPNADMFWNSTQNMQPFKRTAVTNNLYESYVWVPPLMNTISPGSMTVVMHDKGCGTPTTSAGRMSADTVVFSFISKSK